MTCEEYTSSFTRKSASHRSANRPSSAIDHGNFIFQQHDRSILSPLLPAHPIIGDVLRQRWFWHLRVVILVFVNHRQGSIRIGSHCQQRDNQTKYTGDREQERQTAICARPKPGTNKLHARASRHERDKNQLCDRSNQKGCNRGGGLLHALRKPEDASLTLGWDHLLQDGLLCSFHSWNET